MVLTDKVAAPSMSVYDLISFGRYPYLNWTVRLSDLDKQIIERAIQQVHIDHLRNKSIYELSDGQLQMAMIARALSQDSEVILLDEPTAHLDLNNRIEIMNLLRSISHSMKKAILIATHELDLALQTADLVWLAGEDRKITAGIPEDLVLDGSFDEVFRFKGFDLKTGKLQQHPHRNYKIQLQGEGYQCRWTKNALERSGYSVAEVADCKVIVHVEGSTTTWVVEEETAKVFKKIKDLLLFLSNKIQQNNLL